MREYLKLMICVGGCLVLLPIFMVHISGIEVGLYQSSNQEITQDNETIGKVVVGYRYSTWNISISGDENIAHSLKGLDAARDNLNELIF